MAGERRADGGLGEAEVEEFGAALGEHDVGGFQVAMDDAGVVGFFEAVGDFDCDLEDLIGGQRPWGMREARVSPSRYSMTRKSVPSWQPTSCSTQIFGCCRREMALASRSKRAGSGSAD